MGEGPKFRNGLGTNVPQNALDRAKSKTSEDYYRQAKRIEELGFEILNRERKKLMEQGLSYNEASAKLEKDWDKRDKVVKAALDKRRETLSKETGITDKKELKKAAEKQRRDIVKKDRQKKVDAFLKNPTFGYNGKKEHTAWLPDGSSVKISQTKNNNGKVTHWIHEYDNNGTWIRGHEWVAKDEKQAQEAQHDLWLSKIMKLRTKKGGKYSFK